MCFEDKVAEVMLDVTMFSLEVKSSSADYGLFQNEVNRMRDKLVRLFPTASNLDYLVGNSSRNRTLDNQIEQFQLDLEGIRNHLDNQIKLKAVNDKYIDKAQDPVLQIYHSPYSSSEDNGWTTSSSSSTVITGETQEIRERPFYPGQTPNPGNRYLPSPYPPTFSP